MVRLTWHAGAFLVWSILAGIYYAGILLAVSTSWIVAFVPSTIVLPCAAVGLVASCVGLLYLRRARRYASVLPIAWLLFAHAGLLAGIATPAYLAYDRVASGDISYLRPSTPAVYDEYAYRHSTYSNCYRRYDDGGEELFKREYCEQLGRAYCNDLPLRATLVQPQIFANFTDTVRIQTLLAKEVFFGVSIDNKTTLSQFCGTVASDVFSAEPSIDYVCSGCTQLTNSQHHVSGFGSWLQSTCPVSAADAFTSFCLLYSSPKVYSYLLTDERARSCRYTFVQPYGKSWPNLCFWTNFGTLRKSYLDWIRYPAVLVGSVAFLLSISLFLYESARDPLDEDDTLMYEAMTRPSQLSTVPA
ncbi:hypothetical protein ACHHYP_20408 [Achlya hypogyna]|uniref:Transmembrane protein n=1 Tax=Achlya hypogyna TaxID=1202772 RepID=A0A1V9YNI3_ACHHY|nr:hypothetical protein ACHHYP_20408 [Achlya hypogyna]